MPKFKNLTQMTLHYDNANHRYSVVRDESDGKFMIRDNFENIIVERGGWTNRKSAEEFLAVGLMLGHFKGN